MPPIATTMPNVNGDLMLHNLPFRTLNRVSQCIGKKWRNLIEVMPEDMFSIEEVEALASEIYKPDSTPSYSLLLELGYQGKTVRHLISYLERLKLESALVLLKPVEPLIIISQPKDITVQEGSEAIFSCDAKGFPFPKYQWFHCMEVIKNGKAENVKEKVSGGCEAELRIQDVKFKRDRGVYICKVYHVVDGNETKPEYTTYARLTVTPNGKGEGPVIDIQPRSTTVQEGRPLTLSCRALGSPEPQYQWYRFRQVTRDGEVFLESQLVEGATSGDLEMSQVSVQDAGRYFCYVYNTVNGQESATVTVQVEKIEINLHDAGITILKHPVNFPCFPGESVTFEVNAKCICEISYQWYKDGKEIKDANSSKLSLKNIQCTDAGSYYCMLHNAVGFTLPCKKALVTVAGISDNPIGKLFATDKVALLIGNQDYRGDENLCAPESDVGKLYRSLKNMSFKCITLSNLELGEMKTAVRIFCDLLATGVYGLFYFSGHGFQYFGQTYLVPINAPHGYADKDCLCVQEIIQAMQRKNTALNVILLDICRKHNENGGRPRKVEPIVKGNTIIGCASALNSEGFETKYRPGRDNYGIFSEALVARIEEESPIEEVLKLVKFDVNNHTQAGSIQTPAVVSDLKWPRSLKDPIQDEPSQEVKQLQRLFFLNNPFGVPQNSRLTLISGMHLDIVYSATFGNILNITVFAPPTAQATIKDVHIQAQQGVLDVKRQHLRTTSIIKGHREESLSTDGWTWQIRNIQKLQVPLILEVTVHYKESIKTEYGKTEKLVTHLIIDQKILILKLWSICRQPIEDTFPDSSDSSLESSLSPTASYNYHFQNGSY